jgi:hypothetical protein
MDHTETDYNGLSDNDNLDRARIMRQLSKDRHEATGGTPPPEAPAVALAGGKKPKPFIPPTVEDLERMSSIFGPKSSSQLANKVATTNHAEYSRLKQFAVNAGLLYGKRTN